MIGERTSRRDRSVDTVRAYATTGVVLGHWLVTGLVAGPDGALHTASPLVAWPRAAPVSWLLQTLGLFFFAGGFAAARSARGGAALRRLVRPVLTLGAALTVALAAGAALGLPAGTLRTVTTLVIDPLWFLLPYAALAAVTGPALRHLDRRGVLPAAAVLATAVVAAVDAGLLPAAVATAVAVPAAWAVPWLCGVAVARGRLGGRRAGAVLAVAGAVALTVLITVAHYPASAVGVPGQHRSNLSPPSLAAVALGLTQIGVFLLLRPLLNRRAGAPRLNRAAVPVYMSHQSVLLAAALLGLPGVVAAPDQPGWLAARAAWIPVFALVLAFVVTRGRPPYLKLRLRGTLVDGYRRPGRPTEVIAVRDSDPPSRGRAARQPR